MSSSFFGLLMELRLLRPHDEHAIPHKSFSKRVTENDVRSAVRSRQAREPGAASAAIKQEAFKEARRALSKPSIYFWSGAPPLAAMASSFDCPSPLPGPPCSQNDQAEATSAPVLRTIPDAVNISLKKAGSVSDAVVEELAQRTAGLSLRVRSRVQITPQTSNRPRKRVELEEDDGEEHDKENQQQNVEQVQQAKDTGPAPPKPAVTPSR